MLFLYRPHGIVMLEFNKDIEKKEKIYGKGKKIKVVNDLGQEAFAFSLFNRKVSTNCSKVASEEEAFEEVLKDYPGCSIKKCS